MSLLFSTGVIAASGLGGAAPGMVLLTPTSITHSGTSASVGANGQVTFSAVTSLSLNGVFSADFDNYVIAVRATANRNKDIECRLRSSGSDSSASDYIRQRLLASSTTVSAARSGSGTSFATMHFDTTTSGAFVSIYGPYLAQPTALRTVSVDSGSGATIYEYANTNSASSSYDGFTLFVVQGIPAVDEFSGTLAVYGVRS